MTLDPVVTITASLVLSYIFVLAGLHKWQNLQEFEATLRNYQILPEVITGLSIYIIPAVELLTGIALLVPLSSQPAALSAALLLLVYTLAIAINLVRGRRTIDCGCGGAEQKQAISEWLLLRNGVLIFLAYCVTCTPGQRDIFWFDWLVILLASVIGCLFYNIVNQLMINKDLLKSLRSDHG